ncbi:serine/threonine-protein phosphatase 1 regulatory subunit 10 [Triplophysa rosa]|uniref:Serine/threonine-protein phosphatase 1 regulatory subunit 10 n=1 Tax=Triplophysa rosa TaxID=992332 RepID=A0A9W7WGD1_TRIRA|nr:serine/threonine-protein phosphatase 1 regulatory subunit 10 [Triplophysa rosa]XP_057210330.1 serine/threonine-protein phosphatase 1 regulatory subunit 10 [Triplophysa rosa]KAI7798691.1 putative serine/threonine-protein phosphatase 1 regulatory subunit 10-like [Triplophysa rosa]
MAVGPVDPREVLKGVEALLGKDGELRSLEGVAKVFSLMKASHKMVSRCMYLNILLQTKSHDILNRFIRVGGYKLLNSWLTYSKTTTNTPLLQLILLTLQKLPLTVDHLKQNNTAKLVKHLSKSAETEELRKLSLVLVEGWMAIIRSQSVSSGASPNDKKKKKDEGKLRLEVRPREKVADEEKKKDKPKAYAPSHAKIRFTGLEVESPAPVPVKKTPTAPLLGDKYNIKPALLKRPSTTPSDTPPVEKKYKPLNTTPNSAKEIKVKLIPPQPMEATGFLDALNSAPVPGIKIKKKKSKAVSPTSNKPCPFDSRPQSYSGTQAKPSSPEASSSHTPPHENQDLEQPGTPVPTEDPEAMDTSDKPNALSEPRGEEESLTKKGKKKKSVRWAEEDNLKEYFYFDLDETERVNVNKIKDFGEAAKRELMMDRQTFEMARRHSHDTMEERVPWTPPRPLTMLGSLVIPGSSSREKAIQRDREMGILQEIFLTKESVPDSPHEPDPEPYEPMPPRLIPLDEDSTMMEENYMEQTDPTASVGPASGSSEGSKLPPVLANLMGSLGNSGRSPQAQGGTTPANNNPAVNVQELLTSIMGAQGTNQSPEDLIKQPDFSDKIKQLLGSLQQNQNQNQTPPPNAPPINPGLLGHGPGMNMNNMNMQMPMNGGFPPNKPPGGPHFNHPPPPLGHGPPFNASGPRMMGPPPGPQGRGADNGNYWGDESMRGGPHRGGHFHRGRGRGDQSFRGGDQGFRGRGGRGGPRGGHNNMGDMSKRPMCRHFMMKGNCRYENNCAFYHPGVNGPPLPPQHGH